MELEDLLRGGMIDWRLHELLAESIATGRPELRRSSKQSKKLYFQLRHCMDVNQETNKVSFMALPANVVLNIPIVASVVAESPFTKDSSYFEVEVLSVNPARAGSSLVLGAVQKDFLAEQEPGSVDQSVGFKPGDSRVFEEGKAINLTVSGARVGDKAGCGIETQEDDLQYIYFTRNGDRIFETPLDPTVEWFPAVSLSEPKDAVKLLEDYPWRSAKLPVDPHEGLKLCRETGHLSFRSNKPNNLRKESLMVASQPIAKHFSFFEIEIIAMSATDEVAVGIVPENYPPRLPGFKGRSCGFHARAGGIYAGRKKKSDGAPKCQVGDKIGCGVEYRSKGKRNVYFTHNSKAFMEAEINEHCPERVYPAIGLKTKGTGTVCVCIADPSNWLSLGGAVVAKHSVIDMQTTVDEELGTVLVDVETARATYIAPAGTVKDALLVAKTPLTDEHRHFEIEILYGSFITLGLVSSDVADKHPGFMTDSIGYNAESGQVYIDGKSVKDVGKSTYGDRVRCGARTDSDGQQLIFFKKNGKSLCEIPFELTSFNHLYPTVAARSAGQLLAWRLVDRKMWGCEMVEDPSELGSNNPGEQIDRELIECPICRDVLTDPRILPCSIHTFCAECLKSYVAQNAGKRSMPCPICRSIFTLPPGGVNDLPVNTMVSRLLEQSGIVNPDRRQSSAELVSPVGQN